MLAALDRPRAVRDVLAATTHDGAVSANDVLRAVEILAAAKLVTLP